MKTLIITLATNEFVVKDGKLYHKEISRDWISEKGASLGRLGVSARTSY